MGIPEVKITKIRTFHDDFLEAQKDSSSGNNPSPTANKIIKPEAISSTELKIPEEVEKPAKKVEPEVKPAPRETKKEIPEKEPQIKVITEIPPAPVQKSIEPLPKDNTSGNTSKLKKIEVDTSEILDNGRTSLMTARDNVFDVTEGDEYAAEGTIITDQKRKRYRMIPAMISTVRSWFNETSENIQKFSDRDKPQARVQSTESREEIVQKASKRSAIAPQDDFISVSKKITAAPKQQSGNSALTIKERSAMPTPTWGSFKDTEKYDSDNEDATANENIGFANQSPTINSIETNPVTTTQNPPIETVEPTVTEKSTPIVEPAPVTEIEVPAPTPEPVPEMVEQISLPEETVVVEEIDEPPVSEDRVVEEENITTPTQTPAPLYQTTTSTSVPELRFSLWRIGAVSVLAILLGVSSTFWLFGNGEEDVVLEQNAVSSLVRAEEHIPVILGNSAETFWRAAMAVQPRTTTIIAHIYPTLNIAGETQPATIEQVLNILSLQAPGTFTRTITDMNIGLYRNVEPFMVLKVNSFDAAFSGMLTWENTMSADLSPFFGSTVSGTYDAKSRTATQILPPFFVDTIISNVDTRILTDEARNERIIYSFINRNTILITTNRDALSAISAAIK